MLKNIVFLIGMALASVVWSQEVSPEMQKGLVAQDRGDMAGAATHFLAVARNSDQVGADSKEVAEASYRLYNLLLSTGQGFDTAVQFLEMAARAEHPDAQKFLSYLVTLMYKERPNKNVLAALDGRYDLRDAHSLLTSAAEAGHYPAIIQLAEDYTKGRNGALEDPTYGSELAREGVSLALEAAEAGDPDAADNLAHYARMGTGMPKSNEQSLAFQFLATRNFEARAESGSVEAKRELMYRYIAGKSPLGAAESRIRAEYWAHAYLNDVANHRAITYVAGRYQDGELGSNPLLAAHVLYNFASTMGEGDFASKQRDKAAAKMSKQQIDQARSLARTCVNEGLPVCLAALVEN